MTVHPSQVERVVLGVKPPGWQIWDAQNVCMTEHSGQPEEDLPTSRACSLAHAVSSARTSAASLKEKAQQLCGYA